MMTFPLTAKPTITINVSLFGFAILEGLARSISGIF